MAKLKISELASSEALSGFLLISSFLLAIAVSNISEFNLLYKNFVFLPISFGYGSNIYQIPLIQLINDGLMTLFFLLIGLELKYHLVCGEFKDLRTLILPTASAIGGIIIPAFFYLKLNFASDSARGWAIPIATDTAFMLGILSFFGRMISPKLRAFIIGFSLIDDAIALLILAIFYSKSASIIAAILSCLIMIILFLLNRFNVEKTSYYLLMGVLLWVGLVESGVHGTLAGVVVALAIPVKLEDEKINGYFQELEHEMKPWVYFVILPIFAFINSGIVISEISYETLTNPITLGIIFGLFLGKPLGMLIFSYFPVKFNYCELPENVCWPKFAGICALGGIGFTLSLFIGDLSFELSEPNYYMRVGVIVGSLLSSILGVIILCWCSRL